MSIIDTGLEGGLRGVRKPKGRCLGLKRGPDGARGNPNAEGGARCDGAGGAFTVQGNLFRNKQKITRFSSTHRRLSKVFGANFKRSTTQVFMICNMLLGSRYFATVAQRLIQKARVVLLAAGGLGLALTSAVAADWPMFRGGQSLAGIASGELPAKPGLLWTFKTGGPVRSSAAIVGGRVFIGSNDKNLYALDLGSGKKLWAFTNSGQIESSPLVLNGRVYFGSANNNLYGVDAGSGKEIWKYETGEKILGAPNWFVANGETKTNILIGSYDFRLHCVNAATGKSNWVYETGNYINGAPAVADGLTAFGGCDGILYAVALTNGSLATSNEIGAPIAASVALAEGRAYFGHYENEFVCADLKTGSNAWTFRDREFPYFSSPAITKDRVLFGGRDKMLHCVNRADGKSVWSFAARGKVDSSPVVCGDKVVVGSDDGRIYLVSLKDGKELWSYELGRAIDSSAAVADGKIVIGCDDGNVYCFGEKSK
jgi:outer membrane protein assembly factor BamB